MSGHAVCTMTEEDIATVAAIELLSFSHTAIVAPDGLAPTPEARLREELARPWSHSWVIRGENTQAVSFLVAWHVADEVHVLNVAVHPAHRRRGRGAALLAHVIEFARTKQARHLLLEVRRSNTSAIRMYRAAAFFVTGVRRRYYPDDEDAVEMALLLDPRTGEIARRTDEVSLDA
jgi:ribosomal-protein-alanine N-acetyltransferase